MTVAPAFAAGGNPASSGRGESQLRARLRALRGDATRIESADEVLGLGPLEPLLARDCRLYIHSLAQRLKVPVKGTRQDQSSPVPALADGIEVFPKQDEVPADEFGNAIRGPLGVHRGAGKRFWFYGADYSLDSQMSYLLRVKRITEAEMSRFLSGIELPREIPATKRPSLKSYAPNGNGIRREFSILEHLSGKKRRIGRNYFTRCPSCVRQGRDKSGDNLAICIADPRKYKCWAGCRKEEIRAALGCPIRNVGGLSA